MPRPPERIPEVPGLLEQVWKLPRNDDQRLGQLMVNLIRRGTVEMSLEDIERALWGIESDRIAAVLRKELEEFGQRPL